MAGAPSYTDPMARIGVGVLGVAGLVLIAAGVFVAFAVGLPALGLNPYGRNPFDETLRGLGTAVTLYALGAALLAIAFRWIRDHQGPLDVRGFSLAGVVALGIIGWLAVLGNWTGVAMLLTLTIGMIVPIALGGGPWITGLGRRARS